MMSSQILLVSDFDGTITEVDTTTLSPLATEKYIKSNTTDKQQILDDWEERNKLYCSQYLTLVSSLIEHLKTGDKCSCSLKNFSQQLDTFANDSREKLARQKYFDSISLDGLEEIVDKIIFYPDAKEILRNMQKCWNISCKILSVNWFEKLVQVALNNVIDKSDVYTAEFPKYIKDTLVLGKVNGSFGKLDWITTWKREFKIVLYLGDSLTDLLAMLESDYGILVGSNSSVLSVLNICDIKLIPIKDFAGSQGKTHKREHRNKVLYSASSWKDIELFVSRLEHISTR